VNVRTQAPLTGWLDRVRPARFVLAGGINTAVSYGVYALMLGLGLPLALASLISLLSGIAVGFVTQGQFVFRKLSASSLVRYLLAWTAMYGLHFGVVTGLMRFGLPPLGGALVALVLIAGLSYFVLRDLVFRADEAQTNKR
jgi:putative flippase GtrA